MVKMEFTYATRANGRAYTKTVTAPNYKLALAKFEKWAKTNLNSFCILGEQVLA